MMEDNKILELKFWRQSLKNAMIKGDLNYAMHCDTIINKLKQEQYDE